MRVLQSVCGAIALVALASLSTAQVVVQAKSAMSPSGSDGPEAALPLLGADADGVVAQGVGSATAAADGFVVRFRVNAKSEVGTDAIKKFGGVKERFLKNLGALEGMQCVIGSKGRKVSMGRPSAGGMAGMVVMGMGGEEPDEPDLEVTVEEIVTVTVSGMKGDQLVAGLTQILDVARKASIELAGAKSTMENMMMARMLGMPSASQDDAEAPISYTSSESEKAAAEAMKAAVAAAKAQAGRLTGLAGGAVGRVLHIHSSTRTVADRAEGVVHHASVTVRYAISRQ